MRAVRVTQFGGPEVLQLQDVPQPKSGPGEALVRVHVAGVNYADIYMRSGTGRVPLAVPFTAGIEGAGTEEAIGDGVTEVKPGDRVAYASGVGSYAEYHVVKARQLAPLPKDVSFEDGAAVIYLHSSS
jgi:NADPH:quinone reductase